MAAGKIPLIIYVHGHLSSMFYIYIYYISIYIYIHIYIYIIIQWETHRLMTEAHHYPDKFQDPSVVPQMKISEVALVSLDPCWLWWCHDPWWKASHVKPEMKLLLGLLRWKSWCFHKFFFGGDPCKVSRCSSTGDMIDKNNQETWNIDWLVAAWVHTINWEWTLL